MVAPCYTHSVVDSLFLLCCLLFPLEQDREPCDFQAAAWEGMPTGASFIVGSSILSPTAF